MRRIAWWPAKIDSGVFVLAAVFLLIVFAIVFACAETAFRVVRLAQRPPRWHALALLTGAAICLAGVLHLFHVLLSSNDPPPR